MARPDRSRPLTALSQDQSLAAQLTVWAAAFAILTLAGSVWLGAGGEGVALALAGYAVGVGLTLHLFRRGFPHKTLGACNLVTLTRLALTAALLAPLAGPTAAPWTVFAVSALALALDGVDGWLARRDGRASDFGARFDMEVDSALGLLLAINAWAAGMVGPMVLLLGLPRYLFAAGLLVLPWLNGPLPERISRKAVCVAQIAGLMTLQLPLVAGAPAQAIVAGVALALAWSFGRDIAFLWRSRT